MITTIPAEGRPLAKLENPYEAAFAAWLRALTIPAIAIDGTSTAVAWYCKRSKIWISLSPRGVPETSQGTTWLIDVKGRRFPSGRQRQYWKNWTTREDLRGLRRMGAAVRAGSSGLIVFAYLVLNERSPCRVMSYSVIRISITRSWPFVGSSMQRGGARDLAKWETLAVPTRRFRELVRPARHFLQPGWMPRRILLHRMHRYVPYHLILLDNLLLLLRSLSRYRTSQTCCSKSSSFVILIGKRCWLLG